MCSNSIFVFIHGMYGCVGNFVNWQSFTRIDRKQHTCLLITRYLVGGHMLLSDHSVFHFAMWDSHNPGGMPLLKRRHFGHYLTCGDSEEHSTLVVFLFLLYYLGHEVKMKKLQLPPHFKSKCVQSSPVDDQPMQGCHPEASGVRNCLGHPYSRGR